MVSYDATRVLSVAGSVSMMIAQRGCRQRERVQCRKSGRSEPMMPGLASSHNAQCALACGFVIGSKPPTWPDANHRLASSCFGIACPTSISPPVLLARHGGLSSLPPAIVSSSAECQKPARSEEPLGAFPSSLKCPDSLTSGFVIGFGLATSQILSRFLTSTLFLTNIAS